VSEVAGVEKEKPERDTGGGDSSPQPLLNRIRAWRFLPLETNPGIVAFAQTTPGKVVLLVLFAPLLLPSTHLWLPITLAAGACAYAGQYRNRVVALATLGVLLLYPGWID